MRLDSRSSFPEAMENYLLFYGWHFSKKMCEWASSKMYKGTKDKKEYITPYTKEDVEKLLLANNIKMEVTYDSVYIANMAKADFLGSSVPNDSYLAKYIKDVCEDPDQYDGMPFTRFYADCIGSGCAIPWDDLL